MNRRVAAVGFALAVAGGALGSLSASVVGASSEARGYAAALGRIDRPRQSGFFGRGLSLPKRPKKGRRRGR